MADLGAPLLSFPDERASGWGSLIFGALLLAIGLAFGALALTIEAPAQIDADVIGGMVCMAVFLAFFLVPGAVMAGKAARDLIGKPVWHVSRTHVWCVRSGIPATVISLRDEARAALHETRQRGQTMWFAVRLGEHEIQAPSRDVAQKTLELWQAARRG